MHYFNFHTHIYTFVYLFLLVCNNCEKNVITTYPYMYIMHFDHSPFVHFLSSLLSFHTLRTSTPISH